MIGVVVCTHLSLASALIQTAEMIVGKYEAAEAVSVEPGDGMEVVLDRLRDAIGKVDSGDGVVLLCDMFGGTPSNLSLSFLGEGVEVVTGVNLPMLLKLYTERHGRLGDVAASISSHSKESIRVASEILNGGGGSAA